MHIAKDLITSFIGITVVEPRVLGYCVCSTVVHNSPILPRANYLSSHLLTRQFRNHGTFITGTLSQGTSRLPKGTLLIAIGESSRRAAAFPRLDRVGVVGWFGIWANKKKLPDTWRQESTSNPIHNGVLSRAVPLAPRSLVLALADPQPFVIVDDRPHQTPRVN